ncbi:tripartite tricarboxylate transporter TctB family protein [Paraburkholderia phosphatilytica]|uniref:tripartite tricarboxylate transporter TctB family protein n=1 Tax=Paraburkholderia phosphatilytica TaxID=2282883 RepID=UPI000E490473|nr:tripartite tricarboxylate transporter TctB family protein [Paraburkholderia phosphatilytica]
MKGDIAVIEQQATASTQRRDYYAGGLMILLGLGTILKGSSYEIGTLSEMGPGFFPVAVGAVMALSGVGIAFTTIAVQPAAGRPRAEWRGWICILLGVLAFIVLGNHGGLVPATFATVFIAALGDRRNSLRDALLLALAMCVVAVVIFRWALQVQLPLFQWS